MDTETWLPVVGYEGLYCVSDAGRVKSLDRIRRSRPGRTAKVQGQIIAPALISNEHWSVTLAKDGKRTTHWLHIVVLTAFAGPCPSGLQCRHLDGNPANNARSNLKWGTPLENAADRDLHGTTARGDRNAAATLTEAQAREIKYRPRKWGMGKALAAEFGVSESLVSDIRTGRTWSHL